MDVNARSAVGANGFGGYTALFSTVVSQPNFWMNYRKRGPFVAPFTELLLERGADPNVRASIWKQLHPDGSNFTRVTAIRRGVNTATRPRCRGAGDSTIRFFVSEPAMRLIVEAGGVE